MNQPTLEQVCDVMPRRFREMTTWSTEDGEDCKAIRGNNHMLYFEHAGVLPWVIQEYSAYDDADVGIFGETEPGRVVFSSDDVYAAMKQFILLEADLEADEVTSNFAQWLGSAECAEEAKP